MHCPGKKIRAQNLAAVWDGNCKFFGWGGKFPLPEKMLGINAGAAEVSGYRFLNVSNVTVHP